MPRGLPGLPKIKIPENPLGPIRKAIHEGHQQIEKASRGIHSIAEDIRGNIPGTTSTIQETEKAPEIEPQSRTASGTSHVSDKDTLLYQLNHLVAVLSQLEVHLSEGLKIMGVPCDCGAKHALQARTFAMETISIAARMGKETSIYQDIASWTPYIEEIDTPEKVESGDYDETYRKESGTASKFRKKVQSMIATLKESDEDCPGCEEMRESINSFIEKRKKARGGEGMIHRGTDPEAIKVAERFGLVFDGMLKDLYEFTVAKGPEEAKGITFVVKDLSQVESRLAEKLKEFGIEEKRKRR